MQFALEMTSQKSLPNLCFACYSYAPAQAWIGWAGQFSRLFPVFLMGLFSSQVNSGVL
jgi:hypothetical protein